VPHITHARRVVGALGALLALTLAAGTGRASRPRLRLEHVDARRCNRDGAVEVYFTDVELEGTLRRRSSTRYRLVLDGKELDLRPAGASTFDKTARGLHLALVVETTPAYEPHLSQLTQGLRTLIQRIPRRTRFTIVTYNWQPRRALAHGTWRQALQVVETLEPDDTSELNPALDEALTIALRDLGPGRPDEQRLLVLVSDGINRVPRRDVFRGLGTRALTLGVPIHPLAFSPIDERGPLLNLGELAKRSRGTFRWARQVADVPHQLTNLALQIQRQMVLRFTLPSRCARLHRLRVTDGRLVSDEMAIPAMKTAASRRSPVVRVVLFVAALLLAMTALVLLARSMRRTRAARKPAGATGQPPEPERKAPPPDVEPEPAVGYWLLGAGPGVVNLRVHIPPGRSRIGGPASLVPALRRAPQGAELELTEESELLCRDLSGEILVNGERIIDAVQMVDGDILQVGGTQLLVWRGRHHRRA